MRSLTLAATLGAGLATYLVADTALAERGPNRFRSTYFHLQPGIIEVGLDVDGLARPTDWLGFRYGLGVGGYFANSKGFIFTVGGQFEHWLYLTNTSGLHMFRLGPEFRIGGGGRRWFLYGLLGFNGALLLGTYNAFGFRESDLDPGLDFPFGIGFQGLIIGGFYMGTELGPNVDIIFNDEFSNDVNTVVSLTWRGILGWRF